MAPWFGLARFPYPPQLSNMTSEDRTRPSLAKLVRKVAGQAAYAVGKVTKRDYPRFLGLHAAAETALDRGDVLEADRLAEELLGLAERFRNDWNYGAAVHYGHTLRGLCACRYGNVDRAVDHLLRAGRAPGSPELNSEGPDLRLAEALLEAHKREAVVQYLEDCKAFWHGPGGTGARQLNRWLDDLRAGRTPAFRSGGGR